MGHDWIVILVDKGIMFVGGVVFTYLGFFSADPRFRRFRTLFRVAGPACMVIAVILFIERVART